MTSEESCSSRLPRMANSIPSVWSYIVYTHNVAATGEVRYGSSHYHQITNGEQGIAANLRLAAVRFLVTHRRLLWLRHPSQVAEFYRYPSCAGSGGRWGLVRRWPVVASQWESSLSPASTAARRRSRMRRACAAVLRVMR